MKRLLVLVSVLVIGVLSGCGDDDDDPTIGGSGDETSTSTTSDSATSADALLSTAETSLGDVIVDAEGFTLYLFTVSEDEGACTDACAEAWPAVEFVDGATTDGDADAALMGAAPLGDGQQVTYGGHRLYRYVGDTAPGDVNGQGVGDVWYAVTPAGEAVAG